MSSNTGDVENPWEVRRDLVLKRLGRCRDHNTFPRRDRRYEVCEGLPDSGPRFTDQVVSIGDGLRNPRCHVLLTGTLLTVSGVDDLIEDINGNNGGRWFLRLVRHELTPR
jgi:hypothetical protein